jgi:hypothetical protein
MSKISREEINVTEYYKVEVVASLCRIMLKEMLTSSIVYENRYRL